MSIKWSDYQNTVISAFKQLRKNSDLSDVTLVGDDGCQVQAHKIVLSSCSIFFQNMLKNSEKSQSFVYMRGVKEIILNSLVDYIYHGETCIPEENLEEFLAFGIDMKLQGIENIDIDPREPQDFVSFDNFKAKEENMDTVNKIKKELKNKETFKFHCPRGRCRRQFFREKRLRIHIQNSHPDERKFDCGYCELKFFTMKGVNSHQSKKLCKKDKNLQCDLCEHKVDSEKRLLSHKESRHKEFYICKLCDSKWGTYDLYRSHQKSCCRKKYKNKSPI